MRRASPRFHDRAHRSRRPRAAALHQRHHRQAQGRDACARRGRRAPRHRQARARSPSRTTSSGAPPIPAGSPAPRTASSRRSPTASPASSTRATSTPSAGIASSTEQKVTVWYTAPTAIRMMMKGGAELARRHDFPQLRFIASVGEPLNPEAVVWGQEAFGLPIHDNWWQTETGGIMIANYAGDGHQARLDGPAAARHRGGDRAARTDGGSRSRSRRRMCEGELALKRGLAVDVPRLPQRRRALPQVLRRRLVPDRRPGEARCRRLLLVRRPRRRRDQVRRPSDRPVRSRERADGASGGGRGRRHRQARSGGRSKRSRPSSRSSPASRPARRCAASCWASRASGSARRSRRRRSTFSRACRRRAAARSCGAC